MKVTAVRVVLVHEAKLKAYVSVTFDDCFVVRDLKVIERENELFVAMPSKKLKDGQYKDIAHPLNQDTRSAIEEAVLEAYRQQVKSQGLPASGT